MAGERGLDIAELAEQGAGRSRCCGSTTARIRGGSQPSSINDPPRKRHRGGCKVDDGSKFSIEFEQAYADNGLALFVLPLTSPSSTAPSSAPKAHGAARSLRRVTCSPA